MPKIPQYKPKVSPISGKPAFLDPGMKSGLHKANISIGEGLMDVGEAIAERVKRNQQKKDFNEALEKSNKTWGEVKQIITDASQQEGEGVYTLYGETEKKIDDLISKKKSTFQSEDAKTRYSGLAESIKREFLRKASYDIDRKIKRYEKQAYDGYISRNLEGISNDPTSLQPKLEAINKLIDTTYPGQDNTVKKEAVEDDAYRAAFGTMVEQNWRAANNWVDQNQEAIGEDRTRDFKRLVKSYKKAEETELNLKDAAAEKAQREKWRGFRKTIYTQLETDEVNPEALLTLRRAVLKSDLPVQGEHGMNWLIDRIDKKAKDLKDEKVNDFKDYDPIAKSDLMELINTDIPKLESLGGVDYIWSFVGKGKDGGITSDQAEKIQKRYEQRSKPEKEDDPLRSRRFKVALELLKKDRGSNLFLEGKDPNDALNDQEIEDNYMAYSDMLDEIEQRTKDGDDPMEVLRELRQPFLEKKGEGWLNNVGKFITYTFMPWMIPGEKQEIENDRSVVRKKIVRPDSKRQRAINLLQENNKLINDDTIKMVMDQL